MDALHADPDRPHALALAAAKTAVTTTTHAMAVDASLHATRLRSVPCKKRPLSWYKPPVSPGGLVSPVSPSGLVSPGSPGRVVSPGSPGSPVGFVSPASPASSTSSAHEDILGVHMPPLLWPGVHGVHGVAGFPLLPASTAVLHAVARSLASTSTLASLAAPVPATAGTPVTSALAAPVRRQSDFSIEHILRDAGRAPARSTASASPPSSPDAHQDDALRGASGTCGPATALGASAATAHPEGHFEWLQCTRYRPPKLPRSRRRDGPAQRRLGRNPRIPFSPQQVAALEGRFRRSHYLSSADVAALSAQLDLSETRVKIWFQNRRARERRDGEGRSTSPPQQSASHQAPATNVKAPAPSQLLRSPMSAFSAPNTLQRLTEEKDYAMRIGHAQ